MHKPFKFFYQLLAFVCIASLSFACKDDDTEAAPNQQVQVNDWIYDQMKLWYYWEKELPQTTDKNQDPIDYFNSLKSSKDRFSYITDDYEGLINSLQGVNLEAGYEFDLARDANNPNDVLGFVTYVKKNSPAAQVGLKRGDIITHLNGQKLTVDNINALWGKFFENHSINYMRPNAQSGELEVQPVLSLNVVELADNPNYLHKVITTSSGKKVGYFVYNFFAQGNIAQADEENKNAEGAYDKEIRQIIAGFKSQGITELVLDLRYNSGGSVSSARHLGSLLGKGVNDSKVFYTYKWNDGAQAYFEDNADEFADWLSANFIAKPENIGNDLASGTLYVLTGRYTASASELIINGLKPYMNIVLIGDKTVGKNVGSIPFNDTENKSNTYGILPIVFQIFNSAGNSDYGNGFAVDYQVNDLSRNMKPLGDEEEALLAQALALIEGDGGARIKDRESGTLKAERFVPIRSSLERKPWNNRMIEQGLPAEVMPLF